MNFCKVGATVCREHGGRSPQSEYGAAARILAALDPFSGYLIDIAETTYRRWKSGECSTAEVLRTTIAVVDRGLVLSAKLDVRATAEVDTSRTPDEAVEWIPDTELQRIVAQYRAALREARERMTRGEPRPVSTLRLVEPPADAIDAVVVVESANGEVPLAAQPNDVQPAIDAGTSDRQESDQ
jgi:hypothetical protein